MPTLFSFPSRSSATPLAMYGCRRTFTAAAAAATSPSASSSTSADGRLLVAGAEAVEKSGAAAMRSLYRRLLKAGEEGRMMQHCLTVNSLSDSLTYGLRLLRLHRELTTVDVIAQQTPRWRVAKRARQELARRYYAWSLLSLRLQLRSRNAIADVLVYLLFVTMCFLLYEIYRACRIGVNRAEERYRTLSIPIIQTLEALEAAQMRKRELRKEMEKDIVRER
ncbi:conserved hypothetical protein [Leishmania mexicana MHOM/GT/2001/U1103]|uniref:Uncharacterized protein n=1 Tax=Leishmania mexicana (strain MHOM/GT/2001/U1103) TaxID=929439 RepID=E9AML2_LEIMU|nr:conserved hypothetical protein [Leishmania mexicana MHOM/GT/2001/U1103]CBZ24167.1 conserved hypothetical protein [Leishmania mexicana MHOM/GT/2001/U1103]